MTTPPREAIGVHLGNLDHLDADFERLRRHHHLDHPFRPRCPVENRVLLLSSGPRDSGGLYVFVGLLHGSSLAEGRQRVKFSKVQRFWRPVVGVYEAGDYRDDDLMGTIQGWGPTGMHYLPIRALELVEAEAQAALICQDGSKTRKS